MSRRAIIRTGLDAHVEQPRGGRPEPSGFWQQTWRFLRMARSHNVVTSRSDNGHPTLIGGYEAQLSRPAIQCVVPSEGRLLIVATELAWPISSSSQKIVVFPVRRECCPKISLQIGEHPPLIVNF